MHGFFFSTVSIHFILLLVLIAMTKSAQVPFSSWLPAAMAAPTPVSALVHSSTLVTAGLYLLFRFLPSRCEMLFYVGLFTLLVAGLGASLEADIKKIIAYSTLSQLGIIVVSLGLGHKLAMFCHLLSHSAYKALMFMCVGVVIHISFSGQESRSSSCLVRTSPFVSFCLLFSTFCLCGLVFTSGWYSKETILLCCFSPGAGLVSVFLFYLGLGLSLSYSFRLLYSCFSPKVFFTSTLALVTPSLTLKVPFIVIVLLVTFHTIRLQSILLPLSAFLSQVDMVLVYLFCFLGFLLGQLLSTYSTSFVLPTRTLRLLTSSLARYGVGMSKVSYTEVSSLQGYGLGAIFSALSKSYWPRNTIGKILVLLCLLIFL